MITEAAIKAAMKKLPATGKKSVELRDGGARGGGRLVVAIRMRDQTFTAEWYAVWWRDEARKTLKIGVFPDMTVAEARQSFQKDYAPQILAGLDPVGPKARRERRGVTVKDLFDGYVAHLKGQGKPSHKMANHVLLGNLGAVNDLGKTKRAADVTVEDIREHLASIYDRGAIVLARDARAYLHAAYAWALTSANTYTSDVGRTDWGIKVNPVSAIPTDRSEEANRAGDRHLTPAELRQFWQWLDSRQEQYVAAPVLMLIAATGQRVTEILQLTDTAYDRAEKMLDWSKTKNGMPHAIPLPPQAVTLLDGVVKRPKARPMLFPHVTKPGESASVAAIEKMVKRYLKDHPDVPRFTPRDLRRTWKTLSGAAGISKEDRDRLQNHARNDISSRHYDRYDYLTEKRAAMETWSAYLDRILSGQLDNPVARLGVVNG
jgi:integrase